MTFQSILFEVADNRQKETPGAPGYFVDLNLDQIIDAVAADKQEYDLKPFFFTALGKIDTIKYRHEIMQDLENDVTLGFIKSFALKMRRMREHLTQSEKLGYLYQKESWFLDAVDIYGDALSTLEHDLLQAELKSRGLLAFREYLTGYTGSEDFKNLRDETVKLKSDLAGIKYSLRIKGNNIRIRKYESETDYGAAVLETFEKFKQGAAKDYLVKFPDFPEMNDVEAKILDFVAKLYPDIFRRLGNYFEGNTRFQDETTIVFDREIQFYVAYLEFMAKFKTSGLEFCYPRLSDRSREELNYDGFDLALANKLINEDSPVVRNDFYLKDRERVIVVSGPNQGGKTTFARTFGQLHYLASIGCPVPGREAQLFLCDNIFTHFEKEEKVEDLRGKLEDDLTRIYDILNQATSNSVVIINEILTSTTLKDAIFLSRKIMEKIVRLDLICLWVTFVEELASFDEKTVSMVSTVSPENPALRTFRIVRKSVEGLSYAIAIAEKYRLTYESLKERIRL